MNTTTEDININSYNEHVHISKTCILLYERV